MKLWVEPLVIPTYRVGEPDKNPRFYQGRAYQGAEGRVYPYPMWDNLTDLREEETYSAVFLENRYVKLCVLPEIGGRIFSALDKTSGYDFFYRQHVIKPALIGMLGAWISGGVEWNFPHHHRATSFLPVDYTLKENGDGSKTVWVGEVERRHRMKWSIGITLHPGRSYVEVTAVLVNRTPLIHSFLYWANVAVHANPEYQIIFPPGTEYATFHGKNQFARWPLSREIYHGVDYTRGVDVSWWRNHPAATSMFAWDCDGDFLAGYDHGADAGVVHVADHRTVPGKKFWTWGRGDRARMWEKILTEIDGPYLELMVGAYSDNQPDYGWLKPYETKIVKQYWYPVRGLRGVKRANREAAVNLEFDPDGKAEIGFHTTAEYENAKIEVRAKGDIIHEGEADLGPGKPFWMEIALNPGVKGEDLEAVLRSGSGEELISYRPLETTTSPMPEPVKPPSEPGAIETNEELYLTGLRLDQFHHPALDPYPYFEEALRRDPGDARVNAALGVLYLKRGMFKEAEERLRRALERSTRNYTRPSDGGPYYYLGLALRARGAYGSADDAFSKAAWDPAFHAAAHYQLAELACREGDARRTLNHLDRSLTANRFNTRAWSLKAAVLRKEGRIEEAEAAAESALSIDPLEHWAEFELGRMRSGPRLKRGDAIQSRLELGMDYGNCGMWDEAIEALTSMTGSGEEAASHPMLFYHLGYFWERKGDAEKASRYYAKASVLPHEYCFPFRMESIDVLKCAAVSNPADPRAPYYLGCLLYDHQPKAAIEAWERSRSLDEAFAMVHRNLGFAYAHTRRDNAEAIACMERAVVLDPEDPRLYYELDLLYEAGSVPFRKRLALLEDNRETVMKRDDAFLRLVLLYLLSGRYDDALDGMANRHFHVWEGGGRIHNVYVDAHLLRGRERFQEKRYGEALADFIAALEYPENLEVGRPRTPRWNARINYFLGTAYSALGEKEKAMACFREAAGTREVPEGSENLYYMGLALKMLGREEEAQRAFEGMIRFGRKKLEGKGAVDFFAKFGKRTSAEFQRAKDHFILGLGYSGTGEREKARAELEKALALNPGHLWARASLSDLE